MPQSVHIPGVLNKPTTTPEGDRPTFTGGVGLNMLHKHIPDEKILADFPASAALVNFEPCARTNWHWHEKGQLLTVTKGRGWICDKGGKPKSIQAGDVIWCPPDTTHWHGADDGSEMMHMAFSMGGVEWLDEVTDAEYAAKTS